MSFQYALISTCDTYERGVRANQNTVVSHEGLYRGVCTAERRKNNIDILVRITVLGELPATADLRAAKVETRVVGPLVPPVVLWTKYAVSGDRRRASR